MTDAIDAVRPLVRTRQIRDFTDEPLSDAELNALTEVARWTGSSRNNQPWRFIVIRDRTILRRVAEIGTPQTIPLRTAPCRLDRLRICGKDRQRRDECPRLISRFATLFNDN